MTQLKHDNIMRMLLVSLIMIGLFIMSSCTAIQHAVMKGTISRITDAGVYLRIDKKDGASVGQELDVYRITYIGQPKAPSFKREKIGKVKVREIVDDNSAIATVISGKVGVNDIVETKTQ